MMSIYRSILERIFPNFDEMVGRFKDDNGFDSTCVYPMYYHDIEYENMWPSTPRIVVKFDKEDLYCRLVFPLSKEERGNIYPVVKDKGMFNTPSKAKLNFSSLDPYLKQDECDYCWQPGITTRLNIGNIEYKVCSACYNQIKEVI